MADGFGNHGLCLFRCRAMAVVGPSAPSYSWLDTPVVLALQDVIWRCSLCPLALSLATVVLVSRGDGVHGN